MADVIAFFLVLGFILGFVAVVGHGIWVVTATLIRALTGDRAEPALPCPHCGSRFGVRFGMCRSCGQPAFAAPPRPSLRDDLQTTLKQILRLHDKGAISGERHDELAAVLRAELVALDAPPRSTAPSTPPLPSPLTSEPALAEIVDAVLVDSADSSVSAPASPRAIHPLDRPLEPETVSPPRRPGRPLAEVLQSFMEESNIRWGEILAAVLIVLCSVGLVVSLRNTLQQIPYFPAILFTAFTVAFHGAGLYTLRRWNLQTISRVVLLISLLLVPLTFSGAIVLSGTGETQRSVADPLFLGILLAGIVIFCWVCLTASRELVGRAAWPLTIGVLGCSVSQVLIHRTPLAGIGIGTLNAIAAMPVGAFLFASLGHLALARRWPRLSADRVKQILLVLGVALFALLAPLILLLAHSQPQWTALARLSPQLSIAAAAILALGLLIHNRTTARRLTAWQTAGTGIVVCGSVLLLMLVVFTWPDPELLLAVGAINCVILAALGIAGRLPLLYVPSVACAALALTIGLHLAGGHFEEREHLPLKLVQAALMGRTAAALTGLGAIVSGLAGWLLLRKRNESASMILIGAASLAASAIGIALFSGFVHVAAWPQDRDLSAVLLMFYAATLLVAAVIVARDSVAKIPPRIGGLLTSSSSLLLWAALIQALYANATLRGWLESLEVLPDRPILTATLVHGVSTALIALIANWRVAFSGVPEFEAASETRLSRFVVKPLAGGAAISLVLVAPFIGFVLHGAFRSHAVLAAVAAAGWLLLAAARRGPGAIAALQAMAALACGLAVIDHWKAIHPDIAWERSPEHWLWQLMVLAIGAALWSTVRRLTSGREVLRELLGHFKPSVDQALLGVAAVGVAALSFWVVWPNLAYELGFAGLNLPLRQATPLAFGWLALAIVTAALACALWERVTFPGLVGLGLASFAAVWLAADHFTAENAAASAARWAAAFYAAGWGLAYMARRPLHLTAKRLTWLRWARFDSQAGPWFCAQPLAFGGATILILTIVAVNQSFIGAAPRGPAADSIFAQVGPTASYAGPLLAIVAVLLGYALRERQAGFAAGGWLVFQLAINLAFLLYIKDSSNASAAVHALECLQWNSVAAGLYALVWLALERWITPASADPLSRTIADWLWRSPVIVAAGTAAAIVSWAGIAIVDQPISPHASLAIAGAWLSYLAILLVTTSIGWWSLRERESRFAADAGVWLTAALATLIAASLNRLDPGGQWIAFHALEAGWLTVGAVAAGWLVVSLARRSPKTATSAVWLAPHHLSAALLAGLVTFLAIRGNLRDWQQPWWSLGMTLGACGIMTVLGLARRSQLYAYASTLLAALAMILYWAAPVTWAWHRFVFGRFDLTILAWFECVPLAILVAAGFWLWRELASQRQHNQSLDANRYLPRVHAIALLLLVPLQALFRLLITFIQEAAEPWGAYDGAALATALALGALLVATLWDRRATFAAPLLYAWSAAALCLIIGLAREVVATQDERVTALLLAAAALVAITGQLWSYGANFAALGVRLGIDDPVAGLVRTSRWLPVINLLLAALVCGLSLLIVLDIEVHSLRVAASFAPLLVAWGILCLAQDRRRDALQLTALLVAGLSAVYLGWAQLEPLHTAEFWLERVFRLLMVLAALTFIYGLGLPRFLLTAGSWNAATRKAGYIVGTAALATFVAALVLEFALFVPGEGAPVHAPQVIAIAVVLVGLIAGLLSLAVLPGRDPLVLTEHGRHGYVYAAIATAALLFAHLYLCRPYWFDSVLKPYWPFIVMALAFLGVGASELFHRWRITVLAEPLERTGALLPLLPVIGWWAAGSQVDYSALLLTVGILYLALSYTRQSWAAMIAATVAGNGALWSLLSDTQDFSFVQNPQLWLIPPALSALVAAQLNRHRLPPEMLAAIRYGATVVIYVSSTSQLFIDGIGERLWPPMILLLLAVIGSLLGIALRVRAFLFLGTTFTLLALIGMVAHAARSIDHVWPWWVFGILLGVGILVLFGIFEKKRDEMLLLIGRLRKWEN